MEGSLGGGAAGDGVTAWVVSVATPIVLICVALRVFRRSGV
jgi:hypothetical protein